MAPATVICDSSSVASSHPPTPKVSLWTATIPPKAPFFLTATAPPTLPNEQGGGSRRVREHARELEREKCVGVIYLLFRFGSQVC